MADSSTAPGCRSRRRREPRARPRARAVALGIGQRSQPHQLEGAAQGRPALQHRRQRRRRRFAHHDDPAGGDGRQYLIEQARRLGRVRAARRELQEVRHVPEHTLFGGELVVSRRSRSSSCPKYCCPAIRFAAPASNTVQPWRPRAPPAASGSSSCRHAARRRPAPNGRARSGRRPRRARAAP